MTLGRKEGANGEESIPLQSHGEREGKEEPSMVRGQHGWCKGRM